MKLLTIDTTTNSCGVALTVDGRIAAEYLLYLDRTLSARLLECVESAFAIAGLNPDDLDGFGVALGPGSFTGVRIGVATVKGLALATGKPVVGFSSLAMLAMNLPWSLHQVCPIFDARKQEIYAGLYTSRSYPEPLMPDCVAAPDNFLAGISGPTLFLGDGAVKYRQLISDRLGIDAFFAPDHCNQPRASAGAILAEHLLTTSGPSSLHSINPIYIRLSEAEIAKERKEAV